MVLTLSTAIVAASSVDRDSGFDRVVGEHDADEAQVELAVGEEVLAPRVEQHGVRRARDLHALRDEAGQAELLPRSPGRSGSSRGASTRGCRRR